MTHVLVCKTFYWRRQWRWLGKAVVADSARMPTGRPLQSLSLSLSQLFSFCRCVQGFLKPTSGEQRHGSNGLLAHCTVQQRPRFFLHFFRPVVGREGVTWDGVGVETTYLTEGVYNFLLYMSYISLVKSFWVRVYMSVYASFSFIFVWWCTTAVSVLVFCR